MKNRLFSALLSCTLVMVFASAPAFAEPKSEPEKKPKIILNAVEDTAEYSFDQWDKKVTPVKSGLFIDAPSGKGGFGANNLKIDIEGATAVELGLFTGRAHAANSINLSLTDLFGSEVSWSIRIDQISPVQAVRFRLKLSDAKLTLKGKRTTFDYTDIKGYQIKGDWSDQPVQVTILGVRAIF